MCENIERKGVMIMFNGLNKNNTKRVTVHNGRKGKNGVYNANHNDRNYENEMDSSQNKYMSVNPRLTFEEAEAEFYEKHFSLGLGRKNNKYIKQGHKSNCQTMDDYRTNARSCPEETLIYIGNRNNTATAIDLWQIVQEQIAWEQKTFPNVAILDVALHTDEDGAPHIHKRQVWIGHDDDGNEIVNQNQALREMGVEAPNPSKKVDRHNNPKMTYTEAVRSHFKALCRQYGYDIEDIPREASKSGLTLAQYQLDQVRKEEQKISKKLQEAEHKISEADEYVDRVKKDADEYAKSVRESVRGTAKLVDAREKAEEITQEEEKERPWYTQLKSML